MAGPNDNRPEGTPSHIHIEKKKPNWLAWLLLALGILALLLALARCHKDEPRLWQRHLRPLRTPSSAQRPMPASRRL